MPPSSGSQTQFANSQRGKKILKLFPQNFAEDQQPDLSSNMNWRNNSPKSFWISGSHLLWSWWQVEWLAQKRPGWSFCSTWWPDRTKPTASNHFLNCFLTTRTWSLVTAPPAGSVVRRRLWSNRSAGRLYSRSTRHYSPTRPAKTPQCGNPLNLGEVNHHERETVRQNGLVGSFSRLAGGLLTLFLLIKNMFVVCMINWPLASVWLVGSNYRPAVHHDSRNNSKSQPQ